MTRTYIICDRHSKKDLQSREQNLEFMKATSYQWVCIIYVLKNNTMFFVPCVDLK